MLNLVLNLMLLEFNNQSYGEFNNEDFEYYYK